MLTSKLRYLAREFARVINGARRHLVGAQDPVCDGNAMIVISECRCLVHDTGTALICDISIDEYPKCLILKLFDS